MRRERLRDRLERAAGTARKAFLFGMVVVVAPLTKVAVRMAADARDRIAGRPRPRPEPAEPRVVVEDDEPERDPDGRR